MLKQIESKQLRLGMHIHEFCGPWVDHPFWHSKFVLTKSDEIRLINESGVKNLWIDTAVGVDVDASVSAAPQQSVAVTVNDATSSLMPRVSVAEELSRAASICAKSKEAVLTMFQEARMGNAIGADAANELVEEITSSVMRNPSALISLARLKTADNYTYMHSVAVCAMMVALARELGLDAEATRATGLAGLLHDIGKAAMPLDILAKPGKLTGAEFAMIQTHPVAGHQLLAEAGSVGEIALDVCLHHHEKIDGSGYPHGLKDHQISLHAKMGAVCDVYDAITSDRPYKAGWGPAESLRQMTQWSKGHFDERVFQAFVKSIGIYPIGSLVRMQSGRLGVVIEQSENSLLKPVVKVFFSIRSKTYITPEIIDLSQTRVCDQIVDIENAAKWGIHNLDAMWTKN